LPPPPAGDALPGIDDRRQQDIAAAHQDAARLVGERRPGAAIRALQAIARAHPEIATVHYQIGVLSLEMGRTAAAIDAWRTAAALRPDAAGIPRAMALALAAAGRIPEARGQVATALELARGGADLAATHQTAARVALAIGDTAAALQSADAAQAADPALPMRAFVEGRLHIADGRYEEAAAVLEDAAALLSQQDAALEGLQLSLGEALTALDRLEDAEAAYREEIRRFPHGLDAYTGLARLYAASRPLEDTQVIVGELLTAIPTPAGYAAAARILTDLGQRARAEALRSEARVRFRGDPSLALLARDTRR
jgi:tetratricopeptide (TPR) repeat protein